MDQTITITQLDVIATEWIQQEAQRTGMSIEAGVQMSMSMSQEPGLRRLCK